MENKIKLRQMKKMDAEKLYPLTSDKECGKYMKSGPHQTLNQTKEMVELYCKDENLGFIIEDEENSTVGYVSLAIKEGESHSLSIMTFPQYWKKGYSTKAVELIIEEAKQSKKVKSIISYVVNTNIGSCRIMEKLSFTLIDVLEVSKEEIVNVYFLEIA